MPWVLSRLSGEASDGGTTQWRMGATIEVTDKEKEAEQEPMNLLLRHFQEFFWFKGHLVATCEELSYVTGERLVASCKTLATGSELRSQQLRGRRHRPHLSSGRLSR